MSYLCQKKSKEEIIVRIFSILIAKDSILL
jgi:hypothetical protein